ncbi:MAG: glycosyltransferase [Deltaproteobacteria bacterium]|jgi:glycosyltransferase involved in cell wall biosynthesis|nr:glycosyltransferase [Deltaproteobacteria bacterium]
MRKIFILLPSPHPTGPIKGAIALANFIYRDHPTTIVYIKSGPGVDTAIAPSINIVSLANQKFLIQKIIAYRRMIKREGSGRKNVSLSFCFSADFTNLFCANSATTISYVRGNLPINYQFAFGKVGFLVGGFHLWFLRWFNHVIAMNSIMADQIEHYCGKRPHIVGNFIDENFLHPYRKRSTLKKGPFRFIYVGRLTALKNVQSIFNASKVLKDKGIAFHLDIVGDGESMPELARSANQLHITDVLTFHGHLKFPYTLMAQADCLVLPSVTEGVSRSVLEALFLGVPCLVRNIDGNVELIFDGENGYLFQNDEELSDLMIKTAGLSRRPLNKSGNLLPDNYRQKVNTQKLLGIING